MFKAPVKVKGDWVREGMYFLGDDSGCLNDIDDGWTEVKDTDNAQPGKHQTNP